VNNIKLNYSFKEKRHGDLPETFADVSKSFRELGWKAEHSLEDMCRLTV